MEDHQTEDGPRAPGKLGEIARVFLRLGLTAFGGPAAHIAMMESEIVRRRRWVSRERFLDLLGAASLIPGPSSSELAIFIGYERAGGAGLLVAGACFILPASLLTAAIAWAYVRYGALPQVGWIFYGMKPVIIAIVVQAIWGLAPKAVKGRMLLGVFALALLASAFGVDAIAVLLGAGIAACLAHVASRPSKGDAKELAWMGPALTIGVSAPLGLGSLFLFFLKMGAVVFGSGYVLIAFLRSDLVDRWHWLTESQLLDAVAVGQLTPGPVFTTATFIGYVLAGAPGAILATVGIFLPGFGFVAASRPLLARVRKSPIAGAFLDGVNVASVALMVVVTGTLGRAAIVDVPTAAIALASAALLVRWKVGAAWLVAAAVLLGLAVKALH